MFWTLGLLAVLILALLAYLQHPKFGQLPDERHKLTFQNSPNYQQNAFRNQIDTPLFATDQSFIRVLLQNLRSMGSQLGPQTALPSDPAGLRSLKPTQDALIWLGHSSFFIQMAGKRILVDPVFSPNAAPIPRVVSAYAGTTPFNVQDFGEIDYLLITHDHWDHLDYETLRAFQPNVDQVIAPLGIGAYLKGWGYGSIQITEGDWYDRFTLADTLTVHLVPARHYSGRSLERRQTLWGGFVLESPNYRVLISGDTGYGPHFKEIAKRYGNFDLVALDQGQYDPRWPYIHMTPEQALVAAQELGAKRLLPAHVGKYTLAKHPWMEPFNRIAELTRDSDILLTTPLIGEVVALEQDSQQTFTYWWDELSTSNK